MTLKSWIFVVAAAIFLGLAEATFISFLPFPWRSVRPILPLAVLLVILGKPKGALVYGALAGFVLDIFSPAAGVFSLGRFVLVISAVYALAETVLTNRSVYATAALVMFARLLDRLWVESAHFLGARLLHYDIRIESLSLFLATLFWDIVQVSAAFVFLVLFTRRFMVTVAKPHRFYDDP